MEPLFPPTCSFFLFFLAAQSWDAFPRVNGRSLIYILRIESFSFFTHSRALESSPFFERARSLGSLTCHMVVLFVRFAGTLVVVVFLSPLLFFVSFSCVWWLFTTHKKKSWRRRVSIPRSFKKMYVYYTFFPKTTGYLKSKFPNVKWQYNAKHFFNLNYSL